MEELPGGGGGGSPRNFRWGCVARHFRSYFRRKYMPVAFELLSGRSQKEKKKKKKKAVLAVVSRRKSKMHRV